MIGVGLANWLRFLTNMEVKCLPYSGGRYDGEYVGYQVISILPQSFAFKNVHTQAVGNRYDWNRVSSAVMVVSVNVYSPDGMRWLSRIAASNDWWEAGQALISDGDDMAFNNAGSFVDLTGLGDETFRSRFQANMNFHINISDQRTIDSIIEWHLTGTFSNPSQSINSRIDSTTV